MAWHRVAEWLRGALGPAAVRDLGFLAALFAFVGVAYGPALKHPPRADQWCYLADTVDDHTFLDTLKNSYSYNRTRRVDPGDTDLFRPVLFALLAAEKACFEGHFEWVQAFGIALHGAVCVLFLVVLRQVAAVVRPVEKTRESGVPGSDWLMYGTVAFFALNPCVQELVIWGHLHGYLLFVVLLLGSIACLLRYIDRARGGQSAQWALYGGWACAAVGAFTYELGQVYALLAGVLLALDAAPRAGRSQAVALLAAFAAIPVGYQLADRIDREAHKGQYQPENLHPVIVREAFTPATVHHSARYGVYTAVQPFFPSLVQNAYAGQRLWVLETVWGGSRLRVVTPALAVTYAVLLAAALLGAGGAVQLPHARARLLLALPVALYAAYAAVNVLGRMNLRPHPWILSANSYYAYPALLFVLLAASAAWHATGRWAAGLRRGLAAGLLALAGLGAEQVWRANVLVAKEEREWARPLRAVQEFVDAHRHEPGFAFGIDDAASDPVPVIHGQPITRLVFAAWMPGPGAAHRIVVRGDKVFPAPPDQASKR